MALALTPAQRVMADGGDFMLGIAAGVLGSAVVRDMKKKKGHSSASSSGSGASASGGGASSAVREQNRQVQSALNYFAFPVGTPDGVMGRKSQAGVADFQQYMGYPVTGQLTAAEQEFLLSSFKRAEAGGAETEQAIASNPQGVRGLLTAWAAAAPASTVPLTTEAGAPAPSGDTEGKVPSFFAAASAAGGEGGLSEQCRGVAPGGATSVSAQLDANVVLSQQFCLARQATIDESTRLAAQIPGFTPEQVAAQCRDFGPVLSDYVTALGAQPEAEVLERASGWTRASGIAPDNLSRTAQTCLGLGYASDDMTTALGSALVLTALGQTGYAELPAYHLTQGIGVPKRPDLALDWYEASLGAPAQIFDAVSPGRADAIRKAADTVAGKADAGKVPTFATGGASVTKTAASP
jgi:peptidoglycan hydrolase-like protein with peptidoglycan-binding domain